MERKFYINWQAIVEEAKYRRKKRQVTQERLALIAQVSTPTISKFESGSEDIELSSVLRILHALGMADKRMLIFTDDEYQSDFNRKITMFRGQDGEKEIKCAISQEALDDFFDGEFKKNKKEIEHLARKKYLYNELESDGSVLIRTGDLL